MNRVTELLKVNQTLRDENNDKDEQIWVKNIESYQLKEESEDLWERVELLEQIVKSNQDLFISYVSKFTWPRIEMSNLEENGHTASPVDAMCEELIDSRKNIWNLKKEIKNLER